MINRKTMILLLAVFLYGCSQQELRIEKEGMAALEPPFRVACGKSIKLRIDAKKSKDCFAV